MGVLEVDHSPGVELCPLLGDDFGAEAVVLDAVAEPQLSESEVGGRPSRCVLLIVNADIEVRNYSSRQ